MTYEGVLPVNKPSGFTSHDVVAKARRLLGMKRIGHTGTLDPQVTGVLPLCLGRSTRFVEYIQELPKQYEAEVTFGYSTDTEDWTGSRTASLSPEQIAVSEADVRQALAAMVGTIEQIPPMYSAVKVGGKKLYELARAGKEIERKPRAVTILSIEALSFSLDQDYPQVRFRVRCSKGTYIRTLCTAIGKALCLPAVMSALVRTETGSIGLERCLSLEQIEELHRCGELERHILPADRLIDYMPSFSVSEQAALHATQGKPVPFGGTGFQPLPGQIVRLYDPHGTFVGLFRPEHEQELLRPEKVFAVYPASLDGAPTNR